MRKIIFLISVFLFLSSFSHAQNAGALVKVIAEAPSSEKALVLVKQLKAGPVVAAHSKQTVGLFGKKGDFKPESTALNRHYKEELSVFAAPSRFDLASVKTTHVLNLYSEKKADGTMSFRLGLAENYDAGSDGKTFTVISKSHGFSPEAAVRKWRGIGDMSDEGLQFFWELFLEESMVEYPISSGSQFFRIFEILAEDAANKVWKLRAKETTPFCKKGGVYYVKNSDSRILDWKNASYYTTASQPQARVLPKMQNDYLYSFRGERQTGDVFETAAGRKVEVKGIIKTKVGMELIVGRSLDNPDVYHFMFAVNYLDNPGADAYNLNRVKGLNNDLFADHDLRNLSSAKPVENPVVTVYKMVFLSGKNY